MSYDARNIANWFVNRAAADGRILSIMSILKLVYISHGWHLEMYNSPLFEDRIEAWKYGPVIPTVYNAFRKQGIDISKTVHAPEQNLNDQDEGLLQSIYDLYGGMSGGQLSDLTHIEGGPWDIATKTGGYYAPIPDELIKQHYVMKRFRAEQGSSNHR